MESGTKDNALNTTGRSPRRRRLVWAFVILFGLALIAGMYRYLTLCCAPDIPILRGGQSTGLDRLGAIGPIGVPNLAVPVPSAREWTIPTMPKNGFVDIRLDFFGSESGQRPPAPATPNTTPKPS